MKKVLIIGGGFGGLRAAKYLGNRKNLEVTLVDQRNHHLFQPLLYQVAMAGLSPAEIAMPIRSVLSHDKNIQVVLGKAERISPQQKTVFFDFGKLSYDYLILACGSQHSYFGHDQWEEYAPGLKTLAQATEIRRRVFLALETAERESNVERQQHYQTFAIVGGGPTGVELAGALAEICKFTLDRDFRHINPAATRIYLIEAGPRLLSSFHTSLSDYARSTLEGLGASVLTQTKVIEVGKEGLKTSAGELKAGTVIWAAGVQVSPLNQFLETPLDAQGRVKVEKDLSLKNFPSVFVIGDQAHFEDARFGVLPGLAPVALQQGKCAANNVLADMAQKPKRAFEYFDKGQMATIGRKRAVLQIGPIRLRGRLAWLVWVFVHIYYLIGFKNRLLVVFQWAWSYLTYSRGARLIVDRK